MNEPIARRYWSRRKGLFSYLNAYRNISVILNPTTLYKSSSSC